MGIHLDTQGMLEYVVLLLEIMFSESFVCSSAAGLKDGQLF